MPFTMRAIITAAVPTLAALFGIFWFRRKKKPPAAIEDKSPTARSTAAASSRPQADDVTVIPLQSEDASSVMTSPVVFVTQPSQPTPKEESFDIREALAKAVAETMTEVPEESHGGESDSEEESGESVVTAIEASNTNHAKHDVGVIEDACTSSGTSSEVNTPSPCDTIDKQIVVDEAVIEIGESSSNVETEHMEKIEVQEARTVLSIKPKDENEAMEVANGKEGSDDHTHKAANEHQAEPEVEKAVPNQKAENEVVNNSDVEPSVNCIEATEKEVKEEDSKEEEKSQLMNGTQDHVENGLENTNQNANETPENDTEEHTETESGPTDKGMAKSVEGLTNGIESIDVETEETELANGELEKQKSAEKEDEVNLDTEDGVKSLSWSDTIEHSENNNVEKSPEEWSKAQPFVPVSKTSENVEETAQSATAAAATPSSASKSQVSNSKHQSTPKQTSGSGKPTGVVAPSKPQRVDSRKSPRMQQQGNGKGGRGEHREKEHRRRGGRPHWEKLSMSSTNEVAEWSANGETSSDWGNQAEALPNGNENHSDSQSEVSVDSGNASSVCETPSASSPNNEQPEFTVFQFDFPTEYCGRLIGRSGKNINQIKHKTGAEISLKKKSYSGGGRGDFQICSVEGTRSQVHDAVDMMKQRFPPRQFPGITWEQLNVVESSPVLTPEIMQLSLPEGVSVDVIVSSVVDANHVFVQQPTHPTYSSLEKLCFCMNLCYSNQDNVVPQLPRPIDAGVICAAPAYSGWFRAMVVYYDEETDECEIRFVDYGGYLRIKSSVLRQIRSDFTTLPFQATECYLAHVVPPNDEEQFSPEAAGLLETWVHHQMLQTQILAHEETSGIPYILLYKVHSNDNIFFINRELVSSKVARWVEMST